LAEHPAGFLRRAASVARNSPWLMIAVGLHVIVGAALSIVVIRHEREKANATATTIAVNAKRVEEAVKPAVVEPEIDRQKIPDSRQEVELVKFEELAQFIPTEPPEEIDWHQDAGDPDASADESPMSGSSSIGVGSGAIRGNGVSSLLRKRPGTGRGGTPGQLRPTKGQVGTEAAVLEGLRWLMRHQEADGSWSAATLHTHCSTAPACIPPDPALDHTFDTGMTALALLAFLGHGLSTTSLATIGDRAMGEAPRPAGEIVKSGIGWLLARQKDDGSFSDAGARFELPENDTLPTMALCEAYGLSRGNTKLKRQGQLALDFVLAAQRRTADGAPWGFGIGSWSDIEARAARGEIDAETLAAERASCDLSITCWAVMALKSAESCGFDVPAEALAGALAFAVEATAKEASVDGATAIVDAQDRFAAHSARRSALGMLVRAFAGGDVDDPFLRRAADEIASDVPHVTKDMLSVDFYYWFFATLALNQYDGPDSPRADKGLLWERWNDGLVDALLPLQDDSKKRDVCSRGGWLQEARGNRRGRALYNTALNVLTLEVYYRFANVFGSAARDR